MVIERATISNFQFSGHWTDRISVGAVAAIVVWVQRHMRVSWCPGAIAVGRSASTPIGSSYVPLFSQLVRFDD
jgi:hypothetical protein